MSSLSRLKEDCNYDCVAEEDRLATAYTEATGLPKHGEYIRTLNDGVLINHHDEYFFIPSIQLEGWMMVRIGVDANRLKTSYYHTKRREDLVICVVVNDGTPDRKILMDYRK